MDFIAEYRFRFFKVLSVTISIMSLAFLLPCLIYLLYKSKELQQGYYGLRSNIIQLDRSFLQLKDNLTGAGEWDEVGSKEVRAVRRFLSTLIDSGFKFSCSPGWSLNNKSCYYFSSLQKTWPQAKNSCTRNNTTLIIVRTPGEQDFIRSWDERSYWIGLSAFGRPGEYRWVNGDHLAIRYWAVGEPKRWRPDLCVAKGGVEGTWSTEKCKDRRFYICQINGVDQTALQYGMEFLLR